MVFRPLKPGLRRGTLIKQHAESSIQSKEVPLETMRRHVWFRLLRVLRGENLTNQISEWSERDERHGRQRRELAVECGGRCRDTNLKSYIRHPVQKQGRPVPHRRLGQHRGKAECLNELERTNRNAGNAMRRTGSPKGENAGCSRVNHFARGLDAIRDSRIAFQDGFRDTP